MENDQNSDINDAIFNIVKTNLTNDVNPETFLKICLGTATQEEKNEIELPEEVIDKLKKCCDTGYNMASNLDKERNEVTKLKEEMLQLKEETRELKEEVTNIKEEVINMKENLRKMLSKELEIDYDEVQYM